MQKNFFFCVCVYKTHSSNLISLGPPSSAFDLLFCFLCYISPALLRLAKPHIRKVSWDWNGFRFQGGVWGGSKSFLLSLDWPPSRRISPSRGCFLNFVLLRNVYCKKIWSSQNRLLQLPSMLDLYPIIEANTLICTDVSQSYLVTRLPIEFLSFQMKIVGKAQLLTKPKCWKHDQIFLWNSESYRVVYYLWGQAQRGHSDHMV